MNRDLTQCPICESKNIATDVIMVDKPIPTIHLASVCGECGASWMDHYKYTGFDIDQGIDPDTVELDFEEAYEDQKSDNFETLHIYEDDRDH